MKPNITVAKAKKLSILKWTNIVKDNGELTMKTRELRELRDIEHYCGFCERWAVRRGDGVNGSGCNCTECEFAKALGCDCNSITTDNIFDKWGECDIPESRTILAQKILDLIKEIPTTNASKLNNN